MKSTLMYKDIEVLDLDINQKRILLKGSSRVYRQQLFNKTNSLYNSHTT